MRYASWVEREQRFRWKILQSSPMISKDNIYPTCQDCGELCLCHEEKCPNCNSTNIIQQQLGKIGKDELRRTRIRCKHRYDLLFGQGNDKKIIHVP